MVDFTGSRDMVDRYAAPPAELVVEGDAGGRHEEASLDAVEGAGAVAFEGEEVFAGADDRLDPLPDWGEMAALPGFVFAAVSHDSLVEFADSPGELAAASPVSPVSPSSGRASSSVVGE